MNSRSYDDAALIKAIKTLLRRDRPMSPHAVARAWRDLEADAALLAYFRSVETDGEDAWQEELIRVGRAFMAAARPLPADMRQGLNRMGAVANLLPFWRRWGAVIGEQRL